MLVCLTFAFRGSSSSWVQLVVRIRRGTTPASDIGVSSSDYCVLLAYAKSNHCFQRDRPALPNRGSCSFPQTHTHAHTHTHSHKRAHMHRHAEHAHMFMRVCSNSPSLERLRPHSCDLSFLSWEYCGNGDFLFSLWKLPRVTGCTTKQPSVRAAYSARGPGEICMTRRLLLAPKPFVIKADLWSRIGCACFAC